MPLFRFKFMVGVLFLCFLPILSMGCQGSDANTQPASPKEKAVRVKVLTVKPELIRDILILPGATEAVSDVRLAAERDGRVERTCGCEGETLAKGGLIAEVDTETLKAALDRAQASFALADDQAKRRQKLRKKRAISQEVVDQAMTQRTVALGNLREARIALKQGIVRAPTSGIVNHLHIDPGEFVKRGQPVADLVDISRIKIKVRCPEMDVRWLKKGQRARITIDAYPGRQWLGQIEFVAFKADPATRTFEVRVVVDNQDHSIRPGMIARAGFIKRTIQGALAAPLFSIVDKGGERLVFVVQDGKASARVIEIGVIELDRVQITKGLMPGDRLVVKGHKDLEEGMKVSVQKSMAGS